MGFHEVFIISDKVSYLLSYGNKSEVRLYSISYPRTEGISLTVGGVRMHPSHCTL